MISGMRSPIWSRTQAALVHSAAPCKFADVAVIGSPKRSTTARGNRGIGHAHRHVAGIGRRAQRQFGSGANNDRQRPRPEAVRQLVEHADRVSRASSYACDKPEISSESGLCFCRVLIW